MPRFFVYPFKWDCDNARMLRTALDGQLIRLENSRYRQEPDDVIVNWGSSRCPFTGARVVNQPEFVANAVDKSITFDILRNEGIRTPAITRRLSVANQWIKAGHTVIGREQLKGNNGAGIFVLNEHPNKEAKLYVKFIPDTQEFRVNVYKQHIVSIRQKIGPDQAEPAVPIRSGLNNYFFRDIQIPDQWREALRISAVRSTEALGLVFGGVDILFHRPSGLLYILEVNTAPELRGDAVRTLARLIKEDFPQ